MSTIQETIQQIKERPIWLGQHRQDVDALCQALEIAVKALEDRNRFDGKLICGEVLAQIEEVLK